MVARIPIPALCLALAAVSLAAAAVEQPYEFRSRLTCVHRVDRRDMSLKAAPGEFAFADGAQIFVP